MSDQKRGCSRHVFYHVEIYIFVAKAYIITAFKLSLEFKHFYPHFSDSLHCKCLDSKYCKSGNC